MQVIVAFFAAAAEALGVGVGGDSTIETFIFGTE
jgi:hypothetical protein